MKADASYNLSQKIGSKYAGFLSLLISAAIPFIVAINKFGYNSKNISMPIVFDNDEILYATNILSFFQNSPLKNSNFGAPFGQDLNFAFMSVDSGPTFVAAILSHVTGNLFFGLNFFYLLTFAFSGASGYLAARLLGSNKIFSVCAGLTIALVPYHFLWWTGGITVTSYFLLPILFALTILRLQDQLSRKMYFVTLALASLNGIWYSYYSLGFLFIVGTYLLLRSYFDGGFNKILKVLPILVMNTLGFVVVAIPALIAKFQVKGVNYFDERDAWAGIVNSSTLFHYILPFPGSVEDKLAGLFPGGEPYENAAHFQSLLNGSGLFGEGWTGTIPWGLLIVTFSLSFIKAKSKIKSELALQTEIRNVEKLKVLQGLALISLLWSLVGGFGNIFSIAFSSILRGYARFSIIVIILATLFCAIGITEISQKLRNKTLQDLFSKDFGSVILVLVFVITPTALLLNKTPVLAGGTESVVSATKFVESELRTDKGCSILQLPIMHYPYEPPGYPTYRLLRFGLISDKYRWSAGAVGGSPGYQKISQLKGIQSKDLSTLIPQAKPFGFCGILIDETAWNNVANFKPWPAYDSGVPSLEKFIAGFSNSDEIRQINSSAGNYLWIDFNVSKEAN